MACHYIRPFIDRKGNCYPCCFKNCEDSFIIGNISDPDLIEKFENFDINCECGFGKFRKKIENEHISRIHIQTSLLCHGKCAVCYVGAPTRKETIEIDYEAAFNFLSKTNMKQIFLEGGEVPIQKNAMIFAQKIREEINPELLHLLTNGCYNEKTAEKISSIFSNVTISYMAFDKSTYKAETGLDIETTKKFSQIINDCGLATGLRYIITPLSLKECGDFLKFAINFKKPHITIADCDIINYIHTNSYPDYWIQIIRRCVIDFREALLTSRNVIEKNDCTVVIEPRTAALLQIDQKLLDRFGLKRVKLF